MADRNAASKSTDTSHRRTWDRDQYASKAAVREADRRTEGKARYEAALAGKKYHAPPPDPENTIDTEARAARLNVSDRVGKTTIVAAGAGQGKRGKGAGFYCEECDLTYKDNLQYLEHLNSKGHLVATGQTGMVRRVGLAEVVERFEWLKRKREEEKASEVVDLGTRVELAAEVLEREREEKRRRRNEKRRKTKPTDGDGGGVQVKEERDDGVIC